MSKYSIVIIDDDAEIRALLKDYFERHEFTVYTQDNGANLEETLTKHKIDLVILDIIMPEQDGLSLCKQLRKTTNIPILMLTGCDDDVDCIVGLEVGADDYITKPFKSRELLARVKAILRRSEFNQENQVDLPKIKSEHHYAIGPHILDTSAHQIICKDGKVVYIRNADFRLLKTFLKHPNIVLPREKLSDLSQGRMSSPFDRTIDLQVSRLRHFLHEHLAIKNVINTVRNEGYIYSAIQ